MLRFDLLDLGLYSWLFGAKAELLQLLSMKRSLSLKWQKTWKQITAQADDVVVVVVVADEGHAAAAVADGAARDVNPDGEHLVHFAFDEKAKTNGSTKQMINNE